MKSLEFRTDLLVQQTQVQLTEYPDRYKFETPNEPNFWFGNRLSFKSDPTVFDSLIDQFVSDFPDARHVCFGWDVPNLDVDKVAKVFEKSGFTVEGADCLTLDGGLVHHQVLEEVEIRAFETGSDWQQSEVISRTEHLADGLPEKGLTEFLQGRSHGRRQLIQAGLGQWFGAFSGKTLLGDMGVFNNESLIRHQSVQTHADHRRKGVCSALLCASLDWARERVPLATPVIVANSDSDAGRLYRRAGFKLAETTVSAYCAPSSD